MIAATSEIQGFLRFGRNDEFSWRRRSLLPEVGGDYLGRGGDAVDDLGAEDDLHILLVPVLGKMSLDDVHLAGLGEELAGGNRATASYTGGDDRKLAGIGVMKTGNDSVIAVVVGGLLNFAIDAPTQLVVRLGVLDPEVGHVGIVAKAIAEIARHTQGPGVIEGAEEDGGTLAEIGEGGGVFAEEGIAVVAHLEEAGKAHEGLEVVEDDAAHVLVEVTDLVAGVEASRRVWPVNMLWGKQRAMGSLEPEDQGLGMHRGRGAGTLSQNAVTVAVATRTIAARTRLQVRDRAGAWARGWGDGTRPHGARRKAR